jgi:uncharacterized protein VirK/YbjX
MDFMKPYFPSGKGRDTFFFLTHNYYLAKHLTFAQRIDSAISHYSFDRLNYRGTYHREVYHSSRGLELWRKEVDGAQCSIALRATEDNRYEGDLSILCFVNDSRVCRLSFTYVNGTVFGFGPEPTMFVTRNQTDCNAELRLFRKMFKQNSPPYFCIAAACGIAMANGMKFMVMIKDDAQIAYSERYSMSFRNSYSLLWEALGAAKIEDHPAYVLPVPLALRPLSELSRKGHKGRAMARRRNWLEITRSARRTVLSERTNSTPWPLEVTDAASISGG